ncbi:MAG: lysine exporter LysO family protein [Firmicutes bacterium]|jgi:uncharacterized membrane protein YbjE (DUF340 family)|nr:lysine exporter LysO family protein [Bacillota bacterium]
MIYLILALALGGLLGYLTRKAQRVVDLWPKLITLGLFILIFSMGLQLGQNQKVQETIFQLGIQGSIFAFTTALGSMVFSIPLSLYWLKKMKKGEAS